MAQESIKGRAIRRGVVMGKVGARQGDASVWGTGREERDPT